MDSAPPGQQWTGGRRKDEANPSRAAQQSQDGTEIPWTREGNPPKLTVQTSHLSKQSLPVQRADSQGCKAR